MSDFVLIDSDILIDFSRGVTYAKDYLGNLEESFTLGISAITHMELVVGCENKRELSHLERFLNRFTIFHINDDISSLAVDLIKTYNLSHNLLIPDALIGATAIIYKLPFASKNQKDYRFVEALNLIPY